jgi:outer membrane protein OmpA-like peptidoglycan-associated protein
MKSKIAVLCTCCVLLLAAATPTWAHDYDRNDSDNPVRIAAYILHPAGVVLEWTVTRPIHWFVSLPGCSYVFGHDPHPHAEVVVPLTRIEEPAPPEPEAAEIPNAESTAQSRELVDQNVEVKVTPDGVQYTVVGDVLFKSGSADITDQGKALLTELARGIKNDYPDSEIVVEGHTDNEPIKHSAWKSNWELGSQRALNLVHYLSTEAGFDATKMSAVSYGEFRPKAANDTPENKSLNRRAVITVKAKPAAAQQ